MVAYQHGVRSVFILARHTVLGQPVEGHTFQCLSVMLDQIVWAYPVHGHIGRVHQDGADSCVGMRKYELQWAVGRRVLHKGYRREVICLLIIMVGVRVRTQFVTGLNVAGTPCLQATVTHNLDHWPRARVDGVFETLWAVVWQSWWVVTFVFVQ